jgi:hypothetical protein
MAQPDRSSGASGTDRGRSAAGSDAAVVLHCRCGSLSTCEEYRRVFGVEMCMHCKARDELLHKGKVKQLYLLTDADIAHLGSLRRDNPVKSQWTSMRLYLQSQVEAVAVAKHGSLDELETRRRSQSLIQSEKRIRKTRDGREERESEQKRVKVHWAARNRRLLVAI